MASPSGAPERGDAPGGGRRMLRGAGLYLAQIVFSALLGLIALPLYTLFLTPEDFGIVAYATVVASAIAVVLTCGLDSALTRLYHDHRDDAERVQALLSTISLSLFASVGGIGALLIAFGEPLYRALVPDATVAFHPYIQLALGLMIAEQAKNVALALFRTQERAGIVVALKVPLQIGAILMRLLFIGWLHWRAYGWFVAGVAYECVTAVPFLFWLARRIRPSAFSWKLLRESLAFGAPLVPHMAAHWSLNLVDRIILERMVSMASLGIYGFGYQLGRSWNDVNIAVADAWAPLYYRLSQDGQRGRREIARLQERMLAPLAVVSLGCALAAPDLVRLFTTEKFHAAGTIVSMVIAAYAAHGIYIAFISGLFAEKRTRLLPVFSVLAALINVACNLLFIPRLGITGAAWATIAGYGILAICVVLYAQHVHPLPLRNPAGWFVSVTVYAAAWSMIFVTSAQPWRAVALKATAFVMFVAWLGFARALPSRSDLSAFLKPGAAG